MRSLYVSVCVAVLGVLCLSLAASHIVSEHVEHTYFDPVFDATDQLELETAIAAYQTSGLEGLHTYIARLDRAFGPSHALLNSSGVDLLTGANRSALLPQSASHSRGFHHSRFVVTRRSPDGQYWLVSEGPQQARGLGLSSYYYLVAATAMLLGWLATALIVKPIGKVTLAVVQFGRGDLSARTTVKRNDEIGRLARSFNDTADRLERLLGSERQLLMDISHELRSPLTRLKLAATLVRTSADPAVALDRIDREIERITALTAEIVEVTRLEGDPGLLKIGTANLQEVLLEVIASCCADVNALPSKIHLRCDRLVRVTCDVSLITRALENVVRNALRYTPEQSPVSLTVTAEERLVTVLVRDYGSGVPPDQLARIFDPFYRVDAARDLGANGGLGLGLSIVKRIMELHRGSVVAANAEPGLSVALTLPRATAVPGCKIYPAPHVFEGQDAVGT